MNDIPKYSIIIPAYNAEKTISNTINSVIKQNVKDWELIVVENGSTDNTTEVVSSFLYDERIQILHSEKGVSFARNLGIVPSKGEWIIFLDADDELTNNALDIFERVAHQDTDVIIGLYNYEQSICDEAINEITDIETYICECLNNPTRRCNVTGKAFNSKLIHENKFEFDTNLTHAEDSLFYLNVLLHSNKVIQINSSVYLYNYVSGSAVRRANFKQFDKYIPTIKKIQLLIGNKPNIQKEMNSFILNQVLIVLVNNVFTNDSEYKFKDLVTVEKEILNLDIVKNALDNLSFLYCDKVRKIMFRLMQMHSYKLLGMICCYKNYKNTKK